MFYEKVDVILFYKIVYSNIHKGKKNNVMIKFSKELYDLITYKGSLSQSQFTFLRENYNIEYEKGWKNKVYEISFSDKGFLLFLSIGSKNAKDKLSNIDQTILTHMFLTKLIEYKCDFLYGLKNEAHVHSNSYLSEYNTENKDEILEKSKLLKQSIQKVKYYLIHSRKKFDDILNLVIDDLNKKFKDHNISKNRLRKECQKTCREELDNRINKYLNLKVKISKYKDSKI